MLRFGVGARVWLREIMERDGVDAATALFSESTGRVIVTVPREDDVKFRGLCEGRGYPVLRIGVTDAAGDGDEPALEVQDVFTLSLAELRGAVDRRPCPPRSVRRSPSRPSRLSAMTHQDDEYADYNETRQRRVKIIAWVVIVVADPRRRRRHGPRAASSADAEGDIRSRLSGSASARIETRLTPEAEPSGTIAG